MSVILLRCRESDNLKQIVSSLVECLAPFQEDMSWNSNPLCTVNVDCVKFEYVVLAKYHHMLIFEFDLLTKQHILILCKKLL